MRVLILDQDPMNTLSVRQELRDSDTSSIAHSLLEALTILGSSKEPYHVIITGLDLPDCKGVQVLQSLQKASPGVPIIVTSANDNYMAQSEAESFESVFVPEQRTEFNYLKCYMHHSDLMVDRFEEMRAALSDEIEKKTEEALEQKVHVVLREQLDAYGINDEADISNAIKFASSIERIKGRFFLALTNGVAAGFVIALGTGIAVLLRSAGGK